MIAYILIFRRDQIIAVLHSFVRGPERGSDTYAHVKGALLNTTGLSENELQVRFDGWYPKGKILFKKSDVVKNMFDPTPEIKHY